MSEEVIRTSIYAKKRILEPFKETVRRERKIVNGKRQSVSSVIEAFIVQYNMAHSRGNPQLQILSYTEAPDAPQPMRTKCLFIGGVILSEGTLFCRRAGLWIPGVRCYSCEKNELRKQK